MRLSRHYSLDPGNHSYRRIVLKRVSHCVMHVSIRTAKNHARFYSFFFLCRWLTPYVTLRTLSFSDGSHQTGEDCHSIPIHNGAKNYARSLRTRNKFFNCLFSNFNCHLLEEIHDNSEGSRIQSSRAMDGAHVSSSAMSLDAAGELSRTDKRTPTYSHPCYLSPGRSGRYPSRAAYHADSPSRVPTPVLRASSIIFVQARKLQLGDGDVHATGVTE